MTFSTVSAALSCTLCAWDGGQQMDEGLQERRGGANRRTADVAWTGVQVQTPQLRRFLENKLLLA